MTTVVERVEQLERTNEAILQTLELHSKILSQMDKNGQTLLDILNHHTDALNALNMRVDTIEAKVDGLSARFQRIEEEVGSIMPFLREHLGGIG